MGSVLITGGCGFIGSSLAIALRKQGSAVTCFDNLSRRGSEILLARILEHGCTFIHGDVRNEDDFSKLSGDYSAMVECSAEPSVAVGSRGEDALFMVNNNLMGSVRCFEFCRRRNVPVIFLSTSRVYPYQAINALQFREEETRFVYADVNPGVTAKGITTDFCLNGCRSLYGATKLSSELLLQEYSQNFGIPSIVNRCGVIAGPWQMGKADQGVFTYWVASHVQGRPLRYIGFGGAGKQVRDLLHIDDLVDLIVKQLPGIGRFRGRVFNVGGSTHSNLSLLETTRLCRQTTGCRIEVGSEPQTRPADVRWYITDNGETASEFGWQPRRGPAAILSDIAEWVRANDDLLRPVMGG